MNESILTLLTEQPNPRTSRLDRLSCLEMLRIINQEDHRVPSAVSKILPEVARFVEAAARQLKQGGRLFYVGAGTSGRLGILDASECPPTFGTSSGMVQGIIAGGNRAVFRAVEGAEDREENGWKSLAAKKASSADCVVGLSASGRTPFVLGALRYARKHRIPSAGITCNPRSPLVKLADIPLVANVGPEVVAGSTRLKCGTAQKLLLNMISTGTMIRLGKVSGNRMIDLVPKSKKLWERAKGLVMEALGVSEKKAEALLRRAGGSARRAVALGKRVNQ